MLLPFLIQYMYAVYLLTTVFVPVPFDSGQLPVASGHRWRTLLCAAGPLFIGLCGICVINRFWHLASKVHCHLPLEFKWISIIFFAPSLPYWLRFFFFRNFVLLTLRRQIRNLNCHQNAHDMINCQRNRKKRSPLYQFVWLFVCGFQFCTFNGNHYAPLLAIILSDMWHYAVWFKFV